MSIIADYGPPPEGWCTYTQLLEAAGTVSSEPATQARIGEAVAAQWAKCVLFSTKSHYDGVDTTALFFVQDYRDWAVVVRFLRCALRSTC